VSCARGVTCAGRFLYRQRRLGRTFILSFHERCVVTTPRSLSALCSLSDIPIRPVFSLFSSFFYLYVLGHRLLAAIKEERALDVSGDGLITEEEFRRLFSPEVIVAAQVKQEIRCSATSGDVILSSRKRWPRMGIVRWNVHFFLSVAVWLVRGCRPEAAVDF